MLGKVEGEFLWGEILGAKLRVIAAGENLRCAVAFWSESGISELFPSGVPDGAKIILDIAMGSTSAAALTALGAPQNTNVKHSLRMHAKVFVSACGMVACSANASGSALGDDGNGIRNIEAGVFHRVNSEAWKKASVWFDQLFKKALPVGAEEIAWANLLFSARPRASRTRPPSHGSLLEMVVAVPDKFAGIGFVFSSEPVNAEQQKVIRTQAVVVAGHDDHSVGAMPGGGIFRGWGAPIVRKWPGAFIEFWQPRQSLRVYGRRLAVRLPNTEGGSIMSVNDWPGIKRIVDVDWPTAAQIENTDAALAARIRDAQGYFFGNGQELADFIGTMQQNDE